MIRATRTKCSRGTAALEFAMMLPAILMVMGGLIGFGMVLWANLVVASTLQSAVRTCVAKQSSFGNPQAELASCAATQFKQQYEVLFKGTGLCDSAPVTTGLVVTQGIDTLAANRPTYLLTAETTCQKNYIPIMNFYKFNLTTATIRAKSAMPFTP